jgi:hypothetical protein
MTAPERFADRQIPLAPRAPLLPTRQGSEGGSLGCTCRVCGASAWRPLPSQLGEFHSEPLTDLKAAERLLVSLGGELQRWVGPLTDSRINLVTATMLDFSVRAALPVTGRGSASPIESAGVLRHQSVFIRLRAGADSLRAIARSTQFYEAVTNTALRHPHMCAEIKLGAPTREQPSCQFQDFALVPQLPCWSCFAALSERSNNPRHRQLAFYRSPPKDSKSRLRPIRPGAPPRCSCRRARKSSCVWYRSHSTRHNGCRVAPL